MEQIQNPEDRVLLGGRVIRLMAELQRRQDPRFGELLLVMETTREAHPSFDPLHPTASAEAFMQGHLAVVDYVRQRYPNLYRRLQWEYIIPRQS